LVRGIRARIETLKSNPKRCPVDPDSYAFGDERNKKKQATAATVGTPWVPTVNNHGGFGGWAFLEVADQYDNVGSLIRAWVSRRVVPRETLP
jgi:hypothetical protein